MKRAIFIPTIQHTGTWFCIELLANHSANESGHLITHPGLNRLLSEYTGSRILDIDKKGWEKFLFGPELTLIHIHFGMGPTIHDNDMEKFLPASWVENLIQMFPSISPVRDPLLALLSRDARLPDLDHSYIINGFVSLAEIYRRRKIFILPIDLYSRSSHIERFNKLKELMGYFDLEIEPYLAFWAIKWPVHNPTAVLSKESKSRINEYRKYYESKDKKKITKAIPKAYEYLKSNEIILKLFLKELGYKDLLWWD